MNSPAPKKIMVVYNRMNLGGTQIKIIDLLHRLCEKKGVRVSLVLRRAQGVFLHDIPKAVEVIDLGSGKRLFDVPFLLAKLVRVLKRKKPHVIVSFADHMSVLTLLAKLLARALSTPVYVSDEIMLSTYLRHQPAGSLRRLLVRLSYPAATAVITASEAQRNDLITNFGIPHRKIRIIRNWVSPRFDQPVSLGNQQVKKFDVLFVGRLEPQKHVTAFLRVVNLLKKNFPHLTVRVVGTGSEEWRLRREVASLRLSSTVSFEGFSSYTASYYRSCKVFLLTSLYEGQPLVILEAMWMGIPVVALRTRGLDEIVISGKTGFLASSITQVIQVIERLLKNDGERRSLGRAARRFATTYHSPRNLEEFILLVFSEIPH